MLYVFCFMFLFLSATSNSFCSAPGTHTFLIAKIPYKAAAAPATPAENPPQKPKVKPPVPLFDQPQTDPQAKAAAEALSILHSAPAQPAATDKSPQDVRNRQALMRFESAALKMGERAQQILKSPFLPALAPTDLALLATLAKNALQTNPSHGVPLKYCAPYPLSAQAINVVMQAQLQQNIELAIAQFLHDLHKMQRIEALILGKQVHVSPNPARTIPPRFTKEQAEQFKMAAHAQAHAAHPQTSAAAAAASYTAQSIPPLARGAEFDHVVRLSPAQISVAADKQIPVFCLQPTAQKK